MQETIKGKVWKGKEGSDLDRDFKTWGNKVTTGHPVTPHPQRKAIQAWCTQTLSAAIGDSPGRPIPLLLETPGKSGRTSERGSLGPADKKIQGQCYPSPWAWGPPSKHRDAGWQYQEGSQHRMGTNLEHMLCSASLGTPSPNWRLPTARPGKLLLPPWHASEDQWSRPNNPIKALKIKPLNHSPQNYIKPHTLNLNMFTAC